MTEKFQIITAKIGERVEISLEATPSAGFQWEIFLSEPPTSFKVLEVKWEEILDSTYAPGTALIQKFLLQALSKGETRITFHYKRSWEKKIKKEKVIILKVQ